MDIRSFGRAVLASAILAAALGLGTAEARILVSSMEEQIIGRGQVVVAHVPYIKHRTMERIQSDLISDNPKRLRPCSDPKRRGLQPPNMAYTNLKTVNGYYMAGGNVFLTDGLLYAFLSRDFSPETGRASGMDKDSKLGK